MRTRHLQADNSNRVLLAVFDIDGVLCDNTPRLHHILQETPNWSAWFDAADADPPIEPWVRTLNALWLGGVRIALVTHRSCSSREQTKAWLAHNSVHHDFLCMREDGEALTPGTKILHIRNLLEQGHELLSIVEDDPVTCLAYLMCDWPVIYVHSGYYDHKRAKGMETSETVRHTGVHG